METRSTPPTSSISRRLLDPRRSGLDGVSRRGCRALFRDHSDGGQSPARREGCVGETSRPSPDSLPKPHAAEAAGRKRAFATRRRGGSRRAGGAALAARGSEREADPRRFPGRCPTRPARQNLGAEAPCERKTHDEAWLPSQHGLKAITSRNGSAKLTEIDQRDQRDRQGGHHRAGPWSAARLTCAPGARRRRTPLQAESHRTETNAVSKRCRASLERPARGSAKCAVRARAGPVQRRAFPGAWGGTGTNRAAVPRTANSSENARALRSAAGRAARFPSLAAAAPLAPRPRGGPAGAGGGRRRRSPRALRGGERSGGGWGGGGARGIGSGRAGGRGGGGGSGTSPERSASCPRGGAARTPRLASEERHAFLLARKGALEPPRVRARAGSRRGLRGPDRLRRGRRSRDRAAALQI